MSEVEAVIEEVVIEEAVIEEVVEVVTEPKPPAVTKMMEDIAIENKITTIKDNMALAVSNLEERLTESAQELKTECDEKIQELDAEHLDELDSVTKLFERAIQNWEDVLVEQKSVRLREAEAEADADAEESTSVANQL